MASPAPKAPTATPQPGTANQQPAAEGVAFFEKNQQYLEAQRIRMRTTYDLEMLQEMGFCSGLENYSAHLTNRKRGDA